MSNEDWKWLFMIDIGYVRMMDHVMQDNGYLIALVERWNASTNIFILSIGESMITIKDVWWIFKVSIKRDQMIN